MTCWAAKPIMKSFIMVLQNDKLEAISKIVYWFKIAAGPSFPAKQDFPSDQIIFVGPKPEAYGCMSRI